MAKKPPSRRTIRCALHESSAWDQRYGASAHYSARRGVTPSSVLAKAVANFSVVWARKSKNASRYSDGTYNVLYTATKPAVAKSERVHWLVELVFKKAKVTSVKGFLAYACDVTGSHLSFLRGWKGNRQIVHPTDYKYCHSIARTARAKGASHILVPSARRLGGCCVPVFDAKSAVVVDVLEEFRVEWDPMRKKAFIPKSKGREYVRIDEVFRLVK